MIRYTVTNASNCSAFASYNVTVNAIPAPPSIGYATGTTNPQTGAGGAFCTNKTFTLVGTPATGGGAVGTWSSTLISVGANTGIVNTGATTGAASLTYTYTSAAGCSNSRTINGTVATCASRGIANSQWKMDNGQWTIYPNPARSTINLQVDMLIGTGQIVITNLYGKQVKTQPLSMGTNTINISSLSKGMYFISTITNDGKTTKKLVVE